MLSAQFDSALLVPVVAVPLLLSLIYLIRSITSDNGLPDHLPWVGRDRTQVFSKTRAYIRSYKDLVKNAEEGYEKVRDSQATLNTKSTFV